MKYDRAHRPECPCLAFSLAFHVVLLCIHLVYICARCAVLAVGDPARGQFEREFEGTTGTYLCDQTSINCWRVAFVRTPMTESEAGPERPGFSAEGVPPKLVPVCR